MKKTTYLLLAIAGLFLFTACDNYETYGDKKEKERNAINGYISEKGINVISEAAFHAQGDSTDVSSNQYVYLGNSGVYMQIVRKGEGEVLPNNKQLNVLCRFSEYNILNRVSTVTNDSTTRTYDKMSVMRNETTYTASFISGAMASAYGASVPAGWLVPLRYIRLGRWTSETAVAKVRLIVPHTQGHSTSTANVCPYFYDITYQLSRD